MNTEQQEAILKSFRQTLPPHPSNERVIQTIEVALASQEPLNLIFDKITDTITETSKDIVEKGPWRGTLQFC